MMIRLSYDGRLTREDFPTGDIMNQNFEICRQIGNRCSIYEHVRPKRLYSEMECKCKPDPKRPGVAVSMLIDEEGWLKPNHVNVIASWLYEADKHGNPIAGNVLFVGEQYDEDGDLSFCDIDDKEFLSLFGKLSTIAANNKAILERRIPI